MKVGFLGFGEVGYEISSGLVKEGLTEIYAYDSLQNDSQRGLEIQTNAKKAKVTLLSNNTDVVTMCDIIMSVIPGAFALDAAKSVLNKIKPGKIFADMSTSLPSTKKIIDKLVNEKGGKFVDGGMMASLASTHYKVPIVVAGNGASDFIEALTPYGMNIKKISDQAGDAISVKLVRSIYMKGIAALGAEMLEAANVLGVDKLVVDSISNTLDGKSFAFNNEYFVIASVWHGARQVHEMEDVTKMLEDIGVAPIMTRATKKRLTWFANLNARDYFNQKRPGTWKECAKLWDKFRQVRN